ncbi:hypothetical protein OHB26_38070 [Nocardia sp. NBC_01503]|uniref:hypothetical protein n=1 Tax=Nocardia sp. NBC_01503 TaxID=2975997 RepID=UPI002E7B9A83|nr:hypothetical protein [Nocardia sp. NBC_01503]WTL32589.1 hypothetical protein OHB26_38070 [Nocardia sp. NBC_01503]
MHTVEFRIERAELAIAETDIVLVYIDGVELRDLVRPVEGPFAAAEDSPDLAASYAGLVAAEVAWPSRHFLGDSAETWVADGELIILGCTCGIAGCWPLSASLELTPETVVWQDFRNGHRDWDLSALGPFVFDRTQYEAALRATER